MININQTLKWLPAHVISLFTSLCLLVSLLRPAGARQCDFFIHIYPAAYLALHGNYASLYANSKISSIDQSSPYDTFTHTLCPWLPPEQVALFSNFPLTASVLAPLACFGPETAFTLFTVVQLVVLFLCARMFAGEKQNRSLAKIIWLSFSFLPISECLVAGQVDLVVGLLPVVCGFLVCVEGKLYLAGLIWSLAFFKVQYLVMPLIVALSLAAAKKPSCLGGLATGIVALLAIAAVLTSGDTLSSWVHQLKLLSEGMTAGGSVRANHLIAALGPAIVASLPVSFKILASKLALTAASIFAIFTVIKCRKKFINEPFDKALPAVTLVALYLTPIVAPYLFFYSLSVFWLAAAVAFTSRFAENISLLQKRIVISTWLVANVYFVACFISAVRDPNHVLSAPLLLAIPLTVLGVAMLISL